jgi:hypothetical protein
MVNLVELFLFFSCNVLSCNGDFSFSGKLYVAMVILVFQVNYMLVLKLISGAVALIFMLFFLALPSVENTPILFNKIKVSYNLIYLPRKWIPLFFIFNMLSKFLYLFCRVMVAFSKVGEIQRSKNSRQHYLTWLS